MFPTTPPDFLWLEPWEPLTDAGEADRAAAFVRELRNELCPQHVLHGIPAVAVAKRRCSDDVLFATADPARPFAVVHLTWTSRTEPDPRWPATALFRDWDDWVEHGLKPDYREHSEESEDP